MSLQLLYLVNDTTVLPVIDYEEGDALLHTDEHPCCGEAGCPCEEGAATNEAATDDQGDTEVAP